MIVLVGDGGEEVEAGLVGERAAERDPADAGGLRYAEEHVPDGVGAEAVEHVREDEGQVVPQNSVKAPQSDADRKRRQPGRRWSHSQA
mgnify:CR=1 FL=1